MASHDHPRDSRASSRDNRAVGAGGHAHPLASGIGAEDPISGEALERLDGALTELSARLAQGDSMDEHGNATAGDHAHNELKGGWSTSGDPGAGGPIALRSGLDAGAATTVNAYAPPQARHDAFGAVAAHDADDENPWDQTSAEALTSIYETEAGFGGHEATRVADTSPRAVGAAPGRAGGPMVQRHGFAGTATAAALAMPVAEPDWLEDRFAGMANKVEQSLAELRPEKSLNVLNGRLDDFESRMSAVLSEVATRTDLESLKLIEEHIEELARHSEQSNTQFSRLDEIERGLAIVVDRLAGLESDHGNADSAKFDADLEQLITAAADQAAQRLSSLPNQDAHAHRLDELRGLIVAFMDDRRRGDEETTSALETMQEAMIRVLDRVESLDWGPSDRASGSAAMDVAAVAAAPDYETQPAMAATPPLLAGSGQIEAPADDAVQARYVDDDALADFQPADHQDPLGINDGNEMPPAAGDAHTPATATSRTIDRMRQDLIAEARRAKQRADAEAAADPKATRAAKAGAAKAGAAKAVDRIKKVAPIATAGRARPSRRVVIAAVLLLLAVPALLIGVPKLVKKSPQSTPAAIEQVAPEASDEAHEGQPAAPGEANEGNGDDVPPASGRRSDVDTPPLEARGGMLAELPSSAPGILFANADKTLTEDQIRRAYEQHSLAERSSLLATSATGVTPASLLAEPPPPVAAAGPVHGGVNGTLDLPPPSVGPLSLRTAAANGDPSAEFEVGARLAEGNGTDQSFKEAGRWYQRSASQGFAQAQYRLATLYERGLGFKTDLGRARTWYQRAAEQGNVKAMHNLAVLMAGRSGQAPDYAAASQWFERAANHGLADSQYNLAVLFENGLGVTKDPKRAYQWYSLAARSGDKEAVRRRDAVRSELSGVAAGEVDRNLTDWRALASNRLANDPRAAGEEWKKRQSADGNG